MAFTVPNRPDTGIAADQAEPDKGDFQTLGYQKSGVLTGGAVTTSGSNTVAVGAVSGYLNGEYFNITSGSNKSITAPASGNAKFVLILVQKSGTTFNVTALQGTTSNNGESATNARFPDDVDYTNKMLLASVYYAINDTDISTTSIVDKRVFILPQANPTAVSTAPSNAVGAIGEIRVDSSITPAETQSLVWIKTAATTWTNLAKYSTTEPADGTHGTSPTITVDSVITGAAGTQAAVENVGSSSAVELKFTIPRGDTGANAVAPAYAFKVAEGVFSTPHTVNSGDTVVLYGGTDISVTRSGAAFTIAYDGGTPASYNFKVTEGVFSQQW